jgi:phage I-like protein
MARRLRKNLEEVLNADSPLTEQQLKRTVYIELFRSGPQISSSGQKMVFADEDLDQVVTSYDPGRHEAPLIIGHDQDDGTPALGWVREVWRKGKSLWGKVELTPKAERLIRDGVFKKVSSSFYLPDADTNPTPGQLALRHLGLVSIPAVKGLTAFAETPPEGSITITPTESSISFQETLPTMAKRKTEAPVQETKVVDHADGRGMTINVNINGMKATDEEGEAVQETGSPAPYDMEYGDGMAPDPMMEPEPMAQEGMQSLQSASMVEGPDGEEMGDEDGGEAPPVDADGAGPDGMEGEGEGDMPPAEAGSDAEGVDDMSGDDDEQVAADLASQYTEEQLIMALYQLAQGSQEMGEGMMPGYSEAEASEKEVVTTDFSETQAPDPLAAKVAELEEELAAQRRLMRQKEITDFCEGLYNNGKLTEQIVPISDLSRFLETLNPKNNVNFSEAGKATQFEFMKSMLEKLPAMVSFSEVATPASAPKKPKAPKPNADGYVFDERNAEIHAKAVEYAEANSTDYMSALKLVLNDEI